MYVLLELLAAEEKDTGGVTFVSAFQGLFAPYWNADARGYVILACVGGATYSPTLLLQDDHWHYTEDQQESYCSSSIRRGVSTNT